MTDSIVKKMMSGRPSKTDADIRNNLREVIQEIAVYGLSMNGFFNEAAFYGGTALRMFHNLDRYSEDLDFSLKSKNDVIPFITDPRSLNVWKKEFFIDVISRIE